MHRTILVPAIAVLLLISRFGWAQSSPTDSPASVLDLARQARAKADSNQWKESASLWERVVKLNPVQASHWYALGEARSRASDYTAAVPAFEKARDLGAPLMGPSFSQYEIARCHARAGEKEKAIQALERALAMGYPNLGAAASDPDLASLREDPRFKTMLRLADVSKMSREEGWRYDLAVLAGEVRRKGFVVHRNVTLEQFDAKIREIHDAIPKLGDEQIILALMKLMVFLDDGHTAVWNFGKYTKFAGTLPMRFFWFEEGLFVTAADPKLKDLLGAQVMAFDGKPAVEVLEAMNPYINRDRGNPMALKLSAPYRVRNLKFLEANGLIKGPERVTLSVRDVSGATRDVTVAADTTHPDIWNVLPNPPEWVNFASTLPEPPLYLQHMDRPQWFEYLPEEKTVYFQFNKVLNGPRESFAQFTNRLLTFIEQNEEIEKLVIDMRWNNGGNTFLSQPLLLSLIGNQRLNQRGKLFVIIGRRTYSAAQNTATYFERFTNATFVGEPTGSSPNFVGEEVPLTLPYSQVMANVSHLYWQSSWPPDQRIWLAPNIYVPPTFADFRAGRDAALEAILGQPVR